MSERHNPPAPFSAIKLLPLLQQKIKAIDTYPLTAENLVVQQDVYRRLGGLSEEALEEQDEEAFEAFATLECSRKEKDTDLRYAIELSALGVVLSVEGIGAVYFAYEECFQGEQDAAGQIVLLLRLLANGQLAVLHTARHGRFCAAEFLLFDKGTRIPHVLMTDGTYRKWWRASDETGYESHVLRNNYLDEQVAIPKKDLFFLDRTPSGKLQQKGRIFKTAELTPLTKKQYAEAMDKIGGDLLGQKPGEDEWSVLARSWEFWVITLAIGAGLYVAALQGLLPKFVADHPFVIVPVASPAGAFLATLLIMRKNRLRLQDPAHPLLSAENKAAGLLASYAYPVAGMAVASLLLATCFFPVYVFVGTKHAVDYWHVAQGYAPAYLAPAFFLAGFFLAFIKKWWAGIGYFLTILAGVVTLFVVNYARTDGNAATPEPYTTIAILSFFGGPLVALALMIIRWVQRNPAAGQAAGFAAGAELDGTIDDVAEAAAAPDPQAVEKMQRRAAWVGRLQVAVGYAASLAFWVAAYLYRSLPDASVVWGSHWYFVGGLIAAGLVLFGGTVALQAKRLRRKWYGWLADGTALSVFLGLGYGLKDGADDGFDLAWVLMFAAGMTIIILVAIVESMTSKGRLQD